MLKRTIRVIICAGNLLGLAGCTVYPEKKPATLATTTSAEQFERLYWQAVRGGNWQQIQAMQGSSVLFTNRDGEHLNGQQWVDYLKQNPPAEYLIGTAVVTPQGPDLVVSYFASVTSPKSTTPMELAVVSGWQQVAGSLVMVVHSETPRVVNPK